ncbi:hypothetical protein BOC47_11350 [Burkholderia pseudomallei]|nr:hypothetical protein BOC47_11350 [Burkholderia pseudomallei]
MLGQRGVRQGCFENCGGIAASVIDILGDPTSERSPYTRMQAEFFKKDGPVLSAILSGCLDNFCQCPVVEDVMGGRDHSVVVFQENLVPYQREDSGRIVGR